MPSQGTVENDDQGCHIRVERCFCGGDPVISKAGEVNYMLTCPKCRAGACTVGTIEHCATIWNKMQQAIGRSR